MDILDVVYVGAIVALIAVSCAFAAGCDRLGERP